MIKQRVINAVQQALESLDLHAQEVPLDTPQPQFGDYTTNVALQFAKPLKTSPMILATQIAEKISAPDLIEKVTVANPGFINIVIKKDALFAELNEILVHPTDFGKKEANGKTVLFEYGQPNTHKLPHIGHLFSFMFGEAMTRIFEYNGNTIKRLNYQGDVGLHVAKCLYKVLEKGLTEVSQKSLAERVQFLQVCYQEGSAAYEESPELKTEIDNLNKKIYQKDTSIVDIWTTTRGWSVEYYKELEQKLGINYDRYYYESQTFEIGTKIVNENIGKVFEKSEGAIVFKGEEYGLHTRVFINKHGNPTYEGKDMGLMYLKDHDFTYDLSIVTTAAEQLAYWQVVKKALELLFPHLIGKMKHLGFGMISLSTGKMASRTGKILDAVSLITTVTDAIQSEFSIDNREQAEKIAFAAIKHAFLKSNAYSNMSFDLEKSISRDGDSGPYLLYSIVRCNSVLAKEQAPESFSSEYTPTDEELSLLRVLYRLPEITEKAEYAVSPHAIASYLFQLAQTFNIFYQNTPILKSEADAKAFRLCITKATAQILTQGLYLLGIDTVERM